MFDHVAYRLLSWGGMTARNARHLLLGGALASVLLAASSSAQADETWVAAPVAAPIEAAPVAHESTPPSPRTHHARPTHWYGWQPLVADGLTFTVFMASAFNTHRNGSGILLATGASYLLVPPIIHLAHGRPGIAAASLGLRLGVPLGAALLGGGLASGCGDGYCGIAGAALGFVVGIVAASAIDVGALSNEEGNDAPPAEEAAATPPARVRPPPPRSVALTPVGGPRREGGFDLGLGGTF